LRSHFVLASSILDYGQSLPSRRSDSAVREHDRLDYRFSTINYRTHQTTGCVKPKCVGLPGPVRRSNHRIATDWIREIDSWFSKGRYQADLAKDQVIDINLDLALSTKMQTKEADHSAKMDNFERIEKGPGWRADDDAIDPFGKRRLISTFQI